MVYHRLIPSVLLALCLSACSYNPMRTNNHLTGNAGGAMVGAVAGGGTAAALGVTSKPIIGLAAVGGAGVGYYVTTLRFASAGIVQAGGQVYTVGDYVTIELPTDKIFDTNSADLLPGADAAFSSIVMVLNRYPKHNILISGNTSGFGTTKYEHQLSEARAREVAAYLWRHGIDDEQAGGPFDGNEVHMRKLNYVGYGNYFPIANTQTNTGIRENSRIQITAYPPKDQCDISKEARAFNNVGAMDENPTAHARYTPDANPNWSAGTTLSENDTDTSNSLEEAFSDGPPPAVISSPPPRRVRANLKGE